MLGLLFLTTIVFCVMLSIRISIIKKYLKELDIEIARQHRLHVKGFREKSLPLELVLFLNIPRLIIRFWEKLPTWDDLEKQFGTVKDIHQYVDKTLPSIIKEFLKIYRKK